MQLKMKFVISFLVLLTLQESYQYSSKSPKSGDLEQIIQDFTDAMIKLQDLSESNSIHLTGVISHYELQIDNVIRDANIQSLVKSLQDFIEQIESETDNSKCVDESLRKTRIATDELKRGVDFCIVDARTVEEEIKSKLDSITRHVQKVQNISISGLNACVKEETSEDIVECMQNVVERVKTEIPVLEDQIKEIHDIFQQQVEDKIENLTKCLQDTEKDFELKSESILRDLKTCVQNKRYFFRSFSPKTIMDILRELKEKVDSILHLLSHLPTSIAAIQDKINEIISHMNISTVISHLRDEINEIIADGGSHAENCRHDANERVDALVKSSEERSSKCLKEAEDKVDEIQASITALADEGQQILKDMMSQTMKCFTDNNWNPTEFYKCLEGHIGEYEIRVSDLQIEVAEIPNKVKEQATDIVQSLARCVNAIQMDTIKGGQDIIKETENCVLTSSSMYYMK